MVARSDKSMQQWRQSRSSEGRIVVRLVTNRSLRPITPLFTRDAMTLLIEAAKLIYSMFLIALVPHAPDSWDLTRMELETV